MAARIVRCFGRSVKDKERAILATRPVANKFKNTISILIALWICSFPQLRSYHATTIDLDGLRAPNGYCISKPL